MRSLSKTFFSNRLTGRAHRAVDSVSFSLERGTTFGLVGESGCGKSTIGRLLTRLIPATSGEILFHGIDILTLKQGAFRPYRKQIQMLFQHPDTSLNPRMTVLDSLREPFLLHDLPDRSHMDEVIRAHIRPYGIEPELLERRAGQVSGGQIQRIVLARIMLLKPDFIVLDEPTSMLDVSVQAQIMDLLHRVQQETGVAYLLISHDLDLVRHCSDQIAIMREGRILEQGTTETLLTAPKAEYTKTLVQSFEAMKEA